MRNEQEVETMRNYLEEHGSDDDVDARAYDDMKATLEWVLGEQMELV